METNQNKSQELSGNQKRSLTPHELIQRHMENPDEPITDDDINNLKLCDDENAITDRSTGEDTVILSDKEKQQADELADELKKDDTGMSYKADL